MFINHAFLIITTNSSFKMSTGCCEQNVCQKNWMTLFLNFCSPNVGSVVKAYQAPSPEKKIFFFYWEVINSSKNIVQFIFFLGTMEFLSKVILYLVETIKIKSWIKRNQWMSMEQRVHHIVSGWFAVIIAFICYSGVVIQLINCHKQHSCKNKYKFHKIKQEKK